MRVVQAIVYVCFNTREYIKAHQMGRLTRTQDVVVIVISADKIMP